MSDPVLRQLRNEELMTRPWLWKKEYKPIWQSEEEWTEFKEHGGIITDNPM